MSSFVRFGIVLAAIAAVILVPKEIQRRQRLVEERLERQRQEAEEDARVPRYYIETLKAPAEAINSMSEAERQIGIIRTDMFAAQGVQEVMTYRDQLSGEGFIEATADEDPAFEMNSVSWERSFERYFISSMGQACHSVRSDMRLENSSLNGYLKRHPEAWDKEIRPRLSLIVQSRGAPYGLAADAAMALAAGGDRSPALRERLTELVQLGRAEADDAAKILQECGWPVPTPWPNIGDLPTLAPDGSSEGAPTSLQAVASAVNFAGVPQFLDSMRDADGIFVGVRPAATAQNKWRVESLEILRLDVNSGRATEVNLDGPAYILAAGVDAGRGLLATYEQIVDEQSQPGQNVPDRYQLLLRNLETGKSLGDLGPARNVTTLHFDPQNDRLLALEQQNTVSIYDTVNRELLYRLPLHWRSPPVFAERRIMAMMISEGGQPLRLWDERRGLTTVTFNRMHIAPALARPMRGDLLAALDRYSLTMWDLSDIHREYPSFEFRPKMVSTARYQLKYSHDGYGFEAAALAPCAKLVVVLAANHMAIFDTSGRPRGRLSGHKDRVLDVMFVGDKLVSTSMDQTVLIWDWAKVAAWCGRDQNAVDGAK